MIWIRYLAGFSSSFANLSGYCFSKSSMKWSGCCFCAKARDEKKVKSKINIFIVTHLRMIFSNSLHSVDT